MKKVIAIFLLCLVMMTLFACKDVEHAAKDFEASTSGLDRHIKIMTADGQVIREFDGKIDFKTNQTTNGVVFEYEGKRYAYYNCLVEAVEK